MNTVVRARIEPEINAEAVAVLSSIGLSVLRCLHPDNGTDRYRETLAFRALDAQ